MWAKYYYNIIIVRTLAIILINPLGPKLQQLPAVRTLLIVLLVKCVIILLHVNFQKKIYIILKYFFRRANNLSILMC